MDKPHAKLSTIEASGRGFYIEEQSQADGQRTGTFMAFGFGFNKQKVLSAAEKFVQQGKLQNAIAEYEKITKADPKDLTVTNTVGDLYARLGENDKAIDCFKSVGDAYATQGFTVKAIAMYKKLSKVKSSLESTLRLAELYTQQGLFNDARAQYLQVADEFLRAGELEQAVRIFQKTLEMDPDNVAMRMKLAEVYIRLNKKNEAWQIFSSAAESLRSKGALAQAEEILQRMLSLDPANSYALLLRGRTAFDTGDMGAAIENLEKVGDLDSHPDGLRTLLQAYLQTGQLDEAGSLATKLATVHNDTPAILGYASALVSGGQFEDALQVYVEYADRLLASDSAKVLESLHGMISHVRDNPAALEIIIELFNRAGEQTHLTEVYELLAHAYTQSGELEKARDYYLKLTQLEPQNQIHVNNYQQILGKLGGGGSESHLITAEEGAVMVDELEATAPFIEQRYPDETALAVRAALTDAELFISYNMPAKALGPLLMILPRAARDLRVNQRLAALHTRASRFSEAAVCCRTLESIYHDAGYPEEATRYGELAAKYEERASVSPATGEAIPTEVMYEPEASALVEEEVEAPAPPPVAPPAAKPAKKSAPPSAGSKLSFNAPEQAPAPPTSSHGAAEFAVAPSAIPQEGINEIDLSNEWEGTVDDSEVAVVPVEAQEATDSAEKAAPGKTADRSKAIAETVSEIKFYVSNGMAEEAFAALGKLGQLGADDTTLALLQQEVSAAAAAAHAAAEAAEALQAQAPSVEEPAVQAAQEEITIEGEAEPQPEAVDPSEFAVAPQADELGDFVSHLEQSIGHGAPAAPPAREVAPAVAEKPAPAPPRHVPEVPAATQPKSKPAAAAAVAAGTEAQPEPLHKDLLDDFVADLEQSLGDDFKPGADAEKPAEKTPAAAVGKQPQPWPTTKPEAPARPAANANAVSSPAAPTPAASTAPAAKAAAATASPSAEAMMPHAVASTHSAPPASANMSAAGIDLAGMFGELKQELEEDVAAHTDDDPETHYNLGVAFREMGLLDEAISELQKVCEAVERGHSFPHLIQTYTWLAQCFLDKGVPEAAVRWYEQALKIPNLDQQSQVALHYELASAHESAQDRNSALNHFMIVYGKNIDYRDVAERIKALKS